MPWDGYVKYCYEKKKLYHHESMIISDPLAVIRRNPFDGKKIDEFLEKNKKVLDAKNAKSAPNPQK